MQPPQRSAIVGGSVYADVGRPFTFSDVVMRNFGDYPIVVDGVSLVESTPGIKIVGLLAARTPPNWISGDADYPPPFSFPMRPLKGYVIPPGENASHKSVLVIMGLEVSRNGVSGFSAVRIHYHVGSTRFEYIEAYGLAACAPSSKYSQGEHPDCHARLYEQG